MGKKKDKKKSKKKSKKKEREKKKEKTSEIGNLSFLSLLFPHGLLSRLFLINDR